MDGLIGKWIRRNDWLRTLELDVEVLPESNLRVEGVWLMPRIQSQGAAQIFEVLQAIHQWSRTPLPENYVEASKGQE